MDVFSSYEVKIGSSIKITTRIADSLELVTRYLNELMTLISNHKAKIQPGQPKRAIMVGFDIYFDWSNVAGYHASGQDNRVANLQFCFGAHCLIIQLIHLQLDSVLLAKLRGFINYLDVTFVGVGIRDKVAKLEKQHAGVVCKQVIELGPLADRVCRKTEYFSSKLEKLALEIVGIDVKKPQSLGNFNWGARDLTSSQIEYSTICTYASYAIANKLLNA